MSVSFDRESSILLIVDVQQKLLPVIEDHDAMMQRLIQLHDGAQRLNIPIAVSEQYPKGLGHSVPLLAKRFTDETILFEKTLFSSVEGLKKRLPSQKNYSQWVICGIESHICVMQSVRDALLDETIEQVGFVSDAMGTRHKRNHEAAVTRLTQMGAVPLTVEMILFEWLVDAKDEAFKDVSRLIR